MYIFPDVPGSLAFMNVYRTPHTLLKIFYSTFAISPIITPYFLFVIFKTTVTACTQLSA